ncbi:ScbA/BarX family gamma-butyrolactone biosynthesis protein [Streptomyces sp. NPDC020597]|uniref:ScbA/BarX family gamma-butyrolactone biosynthesis protein n=1 Tax=unclassified Streptomyces TaxID=2593676 RepID=UPI0037B8390D
MSLSSMTPLPPDHRRCIGKTDLSEVLVGAVTAKTDDTHVVTARWPRTHRHYTSDSGNYAPHILTESIRQALALISRTAYGVPLSSRMGWQAYNLSATADQLYTDAQDAEVLLTVTHSRVAGRKRGSIRLAASVEATRDGHHLGSAQITYSAHSPAIYERLRGPYADSHAATARALPASAPVACDLTGSRRAHDVVLTATTAPRTWTLRVDPDHPVLFDHPHDHVPGMVLLEACGQAAMATVHPLRALPTGFDTTFLRYVELDQPCRITTTYLRCEPGGPRTIGVRGMQNGRTAFTSTVTVHPLSTGCRRTDGAQRRP